MTPPGGVTAPRSAAVAVIALMLQMLMGGCAPGQLTVEELLAGYAPEPVPNAPSGVSYVEIGRRLLAAGQPETALKTFLRSVRIEGMSAAAMTGAGVAAEQLGRVTEARTYFKAAVDLDPNSILARNNLGVALYKVGDFYSSRAAFEAAFALSGGTNAVAAQNLALVSHKIAELEGEQLVPFDFGYELVRTGSNVYALEPADPPTIPEEEGG